MEHKAGDLIDLSIERIVPRGFGIGFAEGLTVFVPLSVPGDRLRVRLAEVKKRTAFAEIVEIIDPGPQRAVPPCPYFGVCGGCDFQQLDYGSQLAAKSGIVRDCLRRIGKIDLDGEIEIIASPEPLGYRTRARWQVDRESNSLAYFARDSHRPVPVRTCPKVVPELRSVIENFNLSNYPDLSGELLAAAGDGGALSMFYGSHESETLTVTAAGENYTCSAEVFFQANRSLLGALIEAAVGNEEGNAALDLYCGVGLFTLPLARLFKNVTAVESHPKAAEFAARNIATAALTNVDLRGVPVAKFLRGFTASTIDLVLLDPPRSGDDQGVIAAIAALRPRRISYVSCEPSILARDLRILCDGGFTIDKITALDMFPQTHHVETVARLSSL
jgi:23S rRNA (uracil1939-C5)-methyltransferase